MGKRKQSGKCKICGTGFSRDPNKHFTCRIIEEQGTKALKESYVESQRALSEVSNVKKFAGVIPMSRQQAADHLVSSATEQIAAAFDVPPAIIGEGNTTYRAADSAEQLAAALRAAVKSNKEIADSFEIDENGIAHIKDSQKHAFEKNMKDIRDIRELLEDRAEMDRQAKVEIKKYLEKCLADEWRKVPEEARNHYEHSSDPWHDWRGCPTCADAWHDAEDRYYHVSNVNGGSSRYRSYGVRSRGGASG